MLSIACTRIHMVVQKIVWHGQKIVTEVLVIHVVLFINDFLHWYYNMILVTACTYISPGSFTLILKRYLYLLLYRYWSLPVRISLHVLLHCYQQSIYHCDAVKTHMYLWFLCLRKLASIVQLFHTYLQLHCSSRIIQSTKIVKYLLYVLAFLRLFNKVSLFNFSQLIRSSF